MIALVGFIVVLASVVGGFTLAGGKLAALFQVAEILVICGTALGTILISTPLAVLRSLSAKVPKLLQPPPFDRAAYLDALRMLFELFQIARRDGLVAIEGHIENPGSSQVFQRYPRIVHHRHHMAFLCDSLRIVMVGSVPPHDLESLLDGEIEVHHEQEARPIQTLQRVSDALPGIGIVAAVLGIVVTMGALSGPIEKIGHHVAAALTGTFLGVLLAYGFVGPLSIGLEHVNTSETRFFHFLKASVVAFAKGLSPILAVEFARRSIFEEHRPTFTEMEQACKSLKGKAGEAR